MNSLMKRFVVTLLLPVLGMFALFTVITFVMNYSNETNATKELGKNKADVYAYYIDSWLNRRIGEIQSMAENPTLRSMERDQIIEYLKREVGRLPDFEMFFYADTEGNAYTSVDKLAKISDREYFKQIMNGEKFAISDPIVSRATGKKIFVIAAPVHDNTGNVIGLMAGTAELDILTKLISEFKMGKTGYAYVITKKDGTFVAYPPNPDWELTKKLDEVAEGNQKLLDAFHKVESGKEGEVTYTWKGITSEVFYRPLSSVDWILAVKAPISEFYATVNRTTYILILLAVISGIFIFLIMYLIVKGIANAAKKLSDVANSVASGDLTRHDMGIKRKDEIGRIAKALENIVDSVRESIKDTKRFMDGVVKIGDDIGRSAKQANEKMQSTKGSVLTAKGSVDSAVSAIEEVNAGVEEIASASQETAKNAQQADEQMSRMNELQQKGKENLQEAVEKITNIKSMTDRTVKAVNKLQASSQEIGAIVDTINSIAEQTNLLALNAAIEAARAGEAGKGFAVVAEEIRNLAEETKKATANIGKLIEGIQNDTSDAVKVMGETTKAVEAGEEVMDRVADGLSKILEAVSKTSGMIQNIASMAEEQSASTEEIASAIDNVSKSANEITAKIDITEKASDRQMNIMEGLVKKTEELLARSLEELNKHLRKFKM